MPMEGPGKRSRADGSSAGVGDRLSALPDCLLHEIMSRMKARQVVQTCVLSTRWRHLWRSVPRVDADQAEFMPAGGSLLTSYSDSVACWAKFEDFMDTLLSPGNISIARLDAFRLCLTGCSGEDRRASRWIRRGIKYDGAAADIQLQRPFFSPRPTWCLRKLHIGHVFLGALFAEHVGSGCPYLEDLELDRCICGFPAITSDSLKILVLRLCNLIKLSEITSPTLKSLDIDRGRNSEDALLVISAPAAASIFLNVDTVDGFAGGLSLREISTTSIAKASVRLCCREMAYQLKNLGTSVCDVVTNLELSGADPMVIDEGSMVFPQFNNLRALQLNSCDLSDGLQILGLLLRNSPNLERLTLRHCMYSNDSKKRKRSSKSKSKNDTELTPCPNLINAPCENLKLTEIIYQDDDIRQLVELLLRISGDLHNNRIKLIKKS